MNRALMAGVLVFAIALVGFGALGFSGGASAVPWARLTTLSLDEPQLGDEGIYVFSEFDVDGATETLTPTRYEGRAFRWNHTEHLPTADGGSIEVLTVVTQDRYQDGDETYMQPGWYHRDGTGSFVAHASTWYSIVQDGSSVPFLENRNGFYTTQISTWLEGETPFCGANNPFQGGAVRIGAGIELDKACSPFRDVEDSLQFAYDGVDAIGAGNAHVYVHDDERFESRVWFDENRPYPVRFSFLIKGDAPVRQTFDLAKFDREGAVAESPPAPEEVQLPAVHVAQLHPWGPDATDVLVAFSAADAYAAARDDPDAPEFAQFLEEHPDAITVQSDLMEWDRGSRIERQWTFFFVDRTDAASLVVTQTDPQPLFLDAVGMEEPVLGDPTVSYELKPAVAIGWDSTPTLPQQVPDVASAMATAQAFHGEDRQPNRWGHFISCLDDLCTEVEVFVEAGFMRPEEPDGSREDFVTGARNEAAGDGFGIILDRTGVVAAFSRGEWSSEERQNGLLGGSEGQIPWPDVWESQPVIAVQDSVVPWVSAAAMVLGLLAAGSALAVHKGAFGLVVRRPAHPNQLRILSALRKQPGMRYADLSRTTGLAHGVLEHHVRALRSKGQVIRDDSAGVVAYFAHDDATPRGVAILRSPSTRRVYDAIVASPGTGEVALATDLALARSTVSHHTGRLERAGLIERTKEGRGVQWSPQGSLQSSVVARIA